MNKIKKSVVAIIAALMSLAVWADWGSVTIGKVTFEYYSYSDLCQCNDYCIIEHLSFKSGFSGSLTVPATLDGHAVTQFSPYNSYEGEYDEVTSIHFSKGLEWIDGGDLGRNFRKLETITVDAQDEQYKGIDGVLYRTIEWWNGSSSTVKQALELVCYPSGKRDFSYIVPGNVMHFAAYNYYVWDDDYDDYVPVLSVYNEHLTTVTFSESDLSKSMYSYVELSSESFPNLQTAYVPMSRLSKKTQGWTMMDGVQVLHLTGSEPSDWDMGSRLFVPSVSELYFDVSLSSLPAGICENAVNLVSVKLPANLVRIGAKAFMGCENLKNLVLPKSVTDIGKYAFAGCPAINRDDEDFLAALDMDDAAIGDTDTEPWVLDFSESKAGDVSLRSGYVYHSEATDFTLTATASGELSFWWKVSSEENYDYLVLLVNGVQRRRISGEVDWTRVTQTVNVGDVVTWRYMKDESSYDGQDAGWLDLVKMPGTAIETDATDVFVQFADGRYFDKEEWERLRKRLAADIAGAPSDYRLRLYHAVTVVLNALADKRLQDLFETCGYTVDLGDFFCFDDLKASGILSLKGLPQTDEAVDILASVLAPALESAKTDLGVIPESWNGTVTLDASVLSFLSETVYIDRGDVLLAKAAVEGALGAIDYIQAQRLNVNYAKLPVTSESRWSENFKQTGLHGDESKISWTQASLDGQNVIRDVRNHGIEISGKSKDWDVIPAAAKLSSNFWSYDEDNYYSMTHVSDAASWLKCVRNGDELYVAVKSANLSPNGCQSVYLTVRSGTDVVSYYFDGFEASGGVQRSTMSGAWAWGFMIGEYDFEPDEADCVVATGFAELQLKSEEVQFFPADADICLSLSGDAQSQWWGLSAHAEPTDREPSINRLMSDHPELLSAIRDSSKLKSSKQHVKEAMRLGLAADVAIAARTDNHMHFFEYDPADAEKRSTVRSYVEKVKASLDSVQVFEIGNGKKAEKIKIFGGGLFDTRGLTRSLLPPITDDNKIVLSKAPDYTIRGILPETKLATWQRWIEDAGLGDRISDGSGDGSGDPTAIVDIAFDPEHPDFPELRVGKYVELPMTVVADGTLLKLTVGGLPSGLKYDAKTGLVSGTLTKEGACTVKVAYSVGSNKRTLEYPVTVKGMPTGAVGSFNGVAYLDVDGEGDSVPCLFAVTVSSKGALSGAVTVMGKKASFKASGYSDCDEESDALIFENVFLDLKSVGVGSLNLAFWIGGGYAEGWDETDCLSMYATQDRSKEKSYLSLVSPFSGAYLAAFETAIGETCGGATVCSLTVDNKGKTKVAGTLADGGTFSGSGYLTVDDECPEFAYTEMVLTAKSLDKGGLLLSFEVPLSTEGEPWADGFAARYSSGVYTRYDLGQAFCYAYSPDAWVNPKMNADLTYLALDYGYGRALYEFSSKNGVVTGVGKTANGSPVSLKFDNKTGLFSGGGTVDGRKLTVFGAFDRGEFGEGICGLGTAVWADGEISYLEIGAEELDVEEDFGDEDWVNGECPIYVGQSVAFYPSVFVNGERVKLSFTGLPTGLKYVESCCGSPAGIVGTPTKAGTFTVKVTYTICNKKVTRELTMRVQPMPEGVEGTFEGHVWFDDFGSVPLTATVKSSGALSGSFTLAGKKVTFSATGYEGIEDGTFYYFASADLKKALNKTGEGVLDLMLAIGPDGVDVSTEGGTCFDRELIGYGWACRNRSKESAVKSAYAQMVGTWDCGLYTQDGDGTLTIKVDKTGKVSVSGKVGKSSLKGAATLNPISDDLTLFEADVFLTGLNLGIGTCYLPIYFDTYGGIGNDGCYATYVDKTSGETADYEIEYWLPDEQ